MDVESTHFLHGFDIDGGSPHVILTQDNLELILGLSS